MLRVALKMLIGDRAKYVGLLFGITFMSFLVTFAASYFCGFMTRGFALISENPAADVWVMDPAVNSTEHTTNLPASALDRVRSVECVASVSASAATLYNLLERPSHPTSRTAPVNFRACGHRARRHLKRISYTHQRANGLTSTFRAGLQSRHSLVVHGQFGRCGRYRRHALSGHVGRLRGYRRDALHVHSREP